MRAARIQDGQLRIVDVDDPVPGADEALVRISAAGVCHSDLHLARGDWTGVRPHRRSATRRSASSRPSGPAPNASWRSATA